MCPRQGSNFLLLRQKKVTKENRRFRRSQKATLLAGRPRADCSALLGLWGSRRTRYALCERCAQTAARSQKTKHARACSPKALRCSTAHQGAQEKARLRPRVTPRFASAQSSLAQRGRLVFIFPFGRAEQRRALRGARSARPYLTSGGCLSAAANGRVASSARPAKIEQRKAALATRGPRRLGSLLCLLSCRYKKGGRLPGRNPGAAVRSAKPRRENAQGFGPSAPSHGFAAMTRRLSSARCSPAAADLPGRGCGCPAASPRAVHRHETSRRCGSPSPA
jgi:hypothetical protein